MPKEAKEKKRSTNVWRTWGEDAAQLFRDFYFEKYNDDTVPLTIYEDKDRPYSKYAQSGFYKHVKTAKNRVKTFKMLGTGLDNENFRKLVRLDQSPVPEDAAPAEGRDDDGNKNRNNAPENADGEPGEDESEDESFNPDSIDEERDENLTSGFEDESFLQSMKNLSIKVSNKQGEVNRMTTRGNNVKFLEPEIITYEDGRILFQCDMPQGCTGPENFKLHIIPDSAAPVGNKIRLIQKIPKSKLCAQARLYGLIPQDGNVAAQNIHFSSLQTHVNKKLKALTKTHQDECWETLGEVILPFPVELYKVDPYGRPTNDYYIGGDGNREEWATCWLSGVHRRQQMLVTSNPSSAVRVGPSVSTSSSQTLQHNTQFGQNQPHPQFQPTFASFPLFFGNGF